MIAYRTVAVTSFPPPMTTPMGDPPAGRAMTEDAFLTAYIKAQGAMAPIARTPTGFTHGSRPYIALRCHCAAADCPGWAVVHNDPDAVRHFQRLFGAGEAVDHG